MDDDGDADHGERAVHLLGTERWPAIADAYTMGAYGHLAGYEGFGRDMTAERSSVGDGLRHLFLAGVAARLAGDDARARNRALQGVLVATDHRERVAGVDAAACDEWVGHLRTLAGNAEKASDAYDRAAAGYESADPDDPAGATTRPLLQAGTDLLTQLSRPEDAAWDDIHGDGSTALARRVRFARARLGEYVAARVEAGHLHAPRGSTEYGNGSYECPECGSNDINHVAGTVLCLRCDARTERVS
ncbi:hypothetical protein [Halosegnis marinus]|uniref:Uncharacterized protein n=1 Tax=Halosegnis marinus TaxID=3034023 RepID=A0ABD5ZKX4_9EURY|nr:hypothetical protein [Halosegnis sp. DT85]